MILTHVQELTPYLEKKLDELVAKHECAAARRGIGFMQGIVIQGRPVGEVVKKALEKKLLVISAVAAIGPTKRISHARKYDSTSTIASMIIWRRLKFFSLSFSNLLSPHFFIVSIL